MLYRVRYGCLTVQGLQLDEADVSGAVAGLPADRSGKEVPPLSNALTEAYMKLHRQFRGFVPSDVHGLIDRTLWRVVATRLADPSVWLQFQRAALRDEPRRRP